MKTLNPIYVKVGIPIPTDASEIDVVESGSYEVEKVDGKLPWAVINRHNADELINQFRLRREAQDEIQLLLRLHNDVKGWWVERVSRTDQPDQFFGWIRVGGSSALQSYPFKSANEAKNWLLHDPRDGIYPRQ